MAEIRFLAEVTFKLKFFSIKSLYQRCHRNGLFIFITKQDILSGLNIKDLKIIFVLVNIHVFVVKTCFKSRCPSVLLMYNKWNTAFIPKYRAHFLTFRCALLLKNHFFEPFGFPTANFRLLLSGQLNSSDIHHCVTPNLMECY